MTVIFVVVMIGLCLAIMEHAARKAGKHKKGWRMDQKPSDVAKIGDRVRILKGYLCSDHVGKTGTVTRFWSDGDASVILNNGKKTIASKVEVIQPAKEQAMTQQRFKVGQRVRIIKSTPSTYDGEIARIVRVDNDHIHVDIDLDGSMGGWMIYTDGTQGDKVQLLPKTLDNLVEGDVLVDKDDTSDTMTVEHVLKPGLYVLSNADDDSLLYNAKELECRGFIPQQEPEDDKTSMTVAEVAKKLGLNPDKLHIVADKDAA